MNEYLDLKKISKCNILNEMKAMNVLIVMNYIILHFISMYFNTLRGPPFYNQGGGGVEFLSGA